MANAQYMNMSPFMKMFENMDMFKQFNAWGKGSNMDWMGMQNINSVANMQDNIKSMMNMWSNKAPCHHKSMDGMDSMSQIGSKISEDTQAMMTRKAELLQNHASNFLKLMKDIASSSDPESVVSRQAEFARSAYEGFMSDFQELTEMASKSNMEAFEMFSDEMNKRMSKYNKSANKMSSKKK